jgi:hypothetical protein
VGAGTLPAMSEVLLRDLVEADLEVLYEQQREEEAVRRAQFPARDREPFMTHWRTKVLADPANHVQIVVADGEVAGSFMAWWRDDRRFIGNWLGQRFWGPASAQRPRAGSCSANGSGRSTPTRSSETPPSCDSWNDAASAEWAPTTAVISSSRATTWPARSPATAPPQTTARRRPAPARRDRRPAARFSCAARR